MKYIVASLSLLLLFTACTDGDRMRRRLQELQTLNQADSLMTDVSQATTLCRYFDSHGTPNERMLAHYLLARTYADLGEAPQALEEYHTAADCADTTATDCDYQLLARIHGQAAELLGEQALPHEMLEELQKTHICAEKANDTIVWLCSYELRQAAYDMMGDIDSATETLKQAYQLYVQYGYSELANNCLSPLIYYLVRKGLYDESAQYITLYEQSSFSYKNGGYIVAGHELYFYHKGLYYQGINQLDSAECCFRHLLAVASDANSTEAAYRGLYEIFKAKEIVDSTAKYADLCYQTSYQSFSDQSSEKLQRMHALYNYNRHQKAALRHEIEARHTRFVLYVTILCSLLAVFTLIFIIVLHKKREQEKRKRLEMAHQQTITQMQQAQKDLIILNEKRYEELSDIKNQAILKLEKELENYQSLRNHYSPTSLEERLRTSTIYNKFYRKTLAPLSVNLTSVDWEELRALVGREIPRFFSILNSGKEPLRQVEYDLCILIRLGFKPKEQYIIMELGASASSNMRKRLLLKIFGEDGSSKDFDKKIACIV